MSDPMILFMLGSMILAPSLIARAICIRNDRATLSLSLRRGPATQTTWTLSREKVLDPTPLFSAKYSNEAT